MGADKGLAAFNSRFERSLVRSETETSGTARAWLAYRTGLPAVTVLDSLAPVADRSILRYSQQKNDPADRD